MKVDAAPTNIGRSVVEALRGVVGRLSAAGVDAPALDARLLMGEALRTAPERLILEPDRPISSEETARLETLVARRALREPMSHILGRREFWSLSFMITSATLTPRPDSETIVEAVLDALSDRAAPLRVLDLGTGTGCLLLALLSELPNAIGVGVDISHAALAVAVANARALGFDRRAAFLKSDWTTAIGGRFDVVVANPPYIPAAEIDQLAPEVAQFEPRVALDGGPDGLAAYRTLASGVARVAARGGLIALEIGLGQAADVEALAHAKGLRLVARRRDLADIERCLLFAMP